MSWLTKLQNRWQLKNVRQVIVVLIVFACTGFTIKHLEKPVMGWVLGTEDYHFLFKVVFYVFILPVYFTVLLFYGFIFGQFRFFWVFEKKMWRRMIGRKLDENAE